MYPLSIHFLQGFKAAYARNNKSKTKKHLRCFPQCKLSGHSTTGFCGREIRIQVTSGSIGNDELKANLLILGGLRCNLEAGRCLVGQTYSQSAITALIDDHNMIQGSPIAQRGKYYGLYMLSPPATRMGWNYLHSSNLSQRASCHLFEVRGLCGFSHALSLCSHSNPCQHAFFESRSSKGELLSNHSVATWSGSKPIYLCELLHVFSI
jgi:hypothetical protein